MEGNSYHLVFNGVVVQTNNGSFWLFHKNLISRSISINLSHIHKICNKQEGWRTCQAQNEDRLEYSVLINNW